MFSQQPTTDFTSVARLDTAAIRWIADWTASYRSKVSMTNSVHDVKDNGWSDFRTLMNGALFENQWRVNGDNFSANLEQKSDRFEDRSTSGFLGQRTQNALSLGYGSTRGLQSFQLNARHDQDSIFGSKGTAGFAYGYTLSDSLKAITSIATGFRSPTLEQTYSFYGSRDLKPESSRNSDLGLRYAKGSTKMSGVLYRNEFTNLISARPAPAFTYYNIGEATVQGATLSASQAMGRYNIRASFDVLDAKDSQGRNLPLRARHSATAGVDRSVYSWKMGAEVIAVGKRYDNAANTTSLGSYSLINLHATYQINSDWKLLTRINNAADKHFEQVALMATPGRTLFVGLNWQPKN
jgi:vitamin B12 transporter